MTEPIMDRFFTDEELERLLRDNPQLRADPEKYCPTCLTTKTFKWQGTEYACDCQRQLHLHKHYLWAGIGVTYQRLNWMDYEGPDDYVIALANYLDNHKAYVSRGIGLIFTGPYGSGKTMLANLVLKEFVKLNYRCFATTFANTIEMFTAGWKSAAEQRYFQERFISTDVLLLDDVGREERKNSTLPVSTFDNILRTRHQHGRPSILTTNMEMDELGEGYGGAVLSLLREKSLVFQFSGEDYRPKALSREQAEIKAGEMRPIV